jgi:hypothetical protein
MINILFIFAILFVCALAAENNSDMVPPTQESRTKKLESGLNFLLYNNERNNHMYKEAIVHQDIFDAFHRGIVEKHGNPGGWHETHPIWHKRHILRFGHQRVSSRAGLQVNVPEGGYDVLWVRVLNDRWFNMRVRSLDDQDHSQVEKYACGHRSLNEYSPDGGAPDSMWNIHMWCQVPLRRPGAYLLQSEIHSDSWISGIAFGRNLWGHARNSAVAYHWAINGGTNLKWHTHDWNRDQLASIELGAIRTLMVPVVPNGRDKLVYLVEHNNNWTGTMHGSVWIGSQKVDRFRTTWNNAFATHYNSKFYDRYMATVVPAHLIEQDAKFLELRIDMTMSNHHIHIREAGTHDLN